MNNGNKEALAIFRLWRDVGGRIQQLREEIENEDKPMLKKMWANYKRMEKTNEETRKNIARLEANIEEEKKFEETVFPETVRQISQAVKRGVIPPNKRIVDKCTLALIDYRFWEENGYAKLLKHNLPLIISPQIETKSFKQIYDELDQLVPRPPLRSKINFNIIYAEMEKLGIPRPATTYMNSKRIHCQEECTEIENPYNFRKVLPQFEERIFPTLVRKVSSAMRHGRIVPNIRVVDEYTVSFIHRERW